MTAVYHFLGVPFGYILRFLYETICFQNYALSIILLTLIARLFMLPTTIHQQKSTAKTQRIQSKVRKIQQKYAGDQRKIQEETQALYSREGYNPMSAGCSTAMIIQFVLLFGLIGAIYYPLSNFLHLPEAEITILTEAVKGLGDSAMEKSSHLSELLVMENINQLRGLEGVSEATYKAIESVDFRFFGLFSLGDVPMNHTDGFHAIWFIPVLATISTLGTSFYSYYKQKQNDPSGGSAAKSMGCMTVFMAVFTIYFVVNYPAGIGVYWITSGLFGLISTIIIGKIYSPNKVLAKLMVEETVERRSRENSIKLVMSDKETNN